MDSISYLPDLNMISTLVESLGQDYSNESIENKYRSNTTAKRNNTKNMHSSPSVSRISNSQDGIQNNEKQFPSKTASSVPEKISGTNAIRNKIIHSDIIDLTQDTEMEQDFESNSVIKKSNETFSTRIFVDSKTKNSKFDRKKSKNVAMSSILKQREDILSENNINGVVDHQNLPDIPVDVQISGENSPRLNPSHNTMTDGNYTNNQDTHVTEINSKEKVKVWLHSVSTTKKYGQQLSKIKSDPLPSRPEKFISNSETIRLYNELKKNKGKSPVANDDKKSESNDLWNYISKNM